MHLHRLQSSLLLALGVLLKSPVSAFIVKTSQSKIIHTKFQRNNRHHNRNLSSSDNNHAQALEPLTGNRQKAWQYAKKPLLRIGGKGATKTHGNSLRQLLDQHTVVKVKINTGPFDGSLESAFEALKGLAVESGADAEIELIHIRTSDNIIMFGKEGASDMIEKGEFPPPPPPPKEEKE